MIRRLQDEEIEEDSQIIIVNNNYWIYIAHFPSDQSAVAYYYYYYYPIRISSQSFRFTYNDLQLAKRTPHQHLDFNIPHNRLAPDTVWSTKQIEIKYLAQGHKHAGSSGARTHNIDGLVIMSPAFLR